MQPFGLDSVFDLLPQTGPKSLDLGRAGYFSQAKDIVELGNHLTEREKVIAEYWEFSQGRGPNVILWNQFAEFVSSRDHHRLDDNVKLFFALDNAMFDASIAAWDAKRYLDSERPQTAREQLDEIQNEVPKSNPHNNLQLQRGDSQQRLACGKVGSTTSLTLGYALLRYSLGETPTVRRNTLLKWL